MKLIDGSTDKLPNTVHVEQDGNYFFVLPQPHDYANDIFSPALAVLDSETHVGFDMASGRAAQDVIRTYLVGIGVNPSFDY